ncbi:helix-turn-helix domain-containing protein [Streptomyces sp. OfavH-34-F]|uniref:helix-turn-helix transcriptional regulator n=1 Tax=Streptomyces sp. OfavH-34-F TaxID=2917760 RepID=UPI001EF2480B|nr:helix-turn-helix domain-containing protein [Streptomyces sp. OfavH-34-F]MCG7526941.1 helix-turn-helix domain-containing protein [Streptomyces sp. OfavH-34-F]
MAQKRAPETDPQTTLHAGLPDRCLTPDDLKQMFGLPSVETVSAWRKTGAGPPAIRIGKYLRYDPGAVRTWVESNTEAAA